MVWSLSTFLLILVAATLTGESRGGREIDVLIERALTTGKSGEDDSDGKKNESTPLFYTAHDDASWAIKSSKISNILENQKSLYEQFIHECAQGNKDCPREEEERIHQNAKQPSSMVNYTTMGFQKIRAPAPLFALLKEFWEANHDKAVVENNDATPFHNAWQVPTTIVSTEDDELVGGGRNLSAAVWNAARDILEEWTGQKLAGSSVYGIRVYHNQSILTPHADRLPLSMLCFFQ